MTSAKAIRNGQRGRLELEQAGIPDWLVQFVNRAFIEQLRPMLDGITVPLPWVLNPRRKDAVTVTIRWGVIKTLVTAVVQHKASAETCRYAMAKDVAGQPGWQPISRPHVGLLLDLDQATVTRAIQEMERQTQAAAGTGGDGI